MRQFNRIAGFVAVSFVLAFLGRVNKTGLYTVYFKTLADVEIRNSHALDHGDAQFDAALAPKTTAPVQAPSSPNANGDFGQSVRLPFVTVVSKAFTSSESKAQVSLGLRCFLDVAPRAPGA
jgi:hypothetical protein